MRSSWPWGNRWHWKSSY